MRLRGWGLIYYICKFFHKEILRVDAYIEGGGEGLEGVNSGELGDVGAINGGVVKYNLHIFFLHTI